jgi:hypothetical protein
MSRPSLESRRCNVFVGHEQFVFYSMTMSWAGAFESVGSNEAFELTDRMTAPYPGRKRIRTCRTARFGQAR